MTVIGRRLDYCAALEIERDDGDRIPVSGGPCTAPEAFRSRLLVERVAILLLSLLYRATSVVFSQRITKELS